LSKSKDVVFERPPYANELLTEEIQKKFNHQEPWKRHFIKRFMEHGDFARAASEAGVSKEDKALVDPTTIQERPLLEEMKEQGMDNAHLIASLKECMEAQSTRFDSKGQAHVCVDIRTKLKATEFAIKLFNGDSEDDSPPIGKLLEMFKSG